MMTLISICYFDSEMKTFRIKFAGTVIFWVFTEILYEVTREKAAGIRIMSKLFCQKY